MARRIRKYPLEYLLKKLGTGVIQIDGLRVKTNKRIYRIFERSTKCAICGDAGVDLWLVRGTNRHAHFELYTASDEMMNIDHLIPPSKGGSNTKDNLRLTCQSCNSIKGDDYGHLIDAVIHQFDDFVLDSLVL